MAYVVLNSLGVGTWDSSFASVGSNGRWVAFGGLTGADVKLKFNLCKQNKSNKLVRLVAPAVFSLRVPCL